MIVGKRPPANYDPDAPDLQSQWAKTNDIKFAAQAIGRFPAEPPVWAIIACRSYHVKQEREASAGLNPDGQGQVLDEMFRVQFEFYDVYEASNVSNASFSPPPLLELQREAILRSEGIGKTDYKFRSWQMATDRRWKEEAKGFKIEPEFRLPMTPRYHRILKEWGERNVGGPVTAYDFSWERYLAKIAEEG
jgi:hypothetical protein